MVGDMAVHYSSATDEWATPRDFLARMASTFGPFDLDPCALPSSTAAPRYFTPTVDGLTQPWTGRVWMNPPYGRGIGAWTLKADRETWSGRADIVVGLVPARTDTKWWHRDVIGAASAVYFVRGRLTFGDATACAPFPSAVVVWRPLRPDARPVFDTMDATERPASLW